MYSDHIVATLPLCPAWEARTLSGLADELPQMPWAVVEFWAEDCLFSRLFAPARRVLRERYEHCCPLLRCEVRGNEPACVNYGVSGLPAIILFAHGRWRKRWIGETHPCVITWAINPILVNGGAFEKHRGA